MELNDMQLIIEKQLLKNNFTKYRDGHKPEAFCEHITDGSAKAVINWFNSWQSQVSAHYLITEDLRIIQFVEDEDQSWGAGEMVNPTSELVLEKKINPNRFLINIEHESVGDDITEDQYKLSAELHRHLSKKWNIPLTRKYLIKHNEIKSTKSCPRKISVDKIIYFATEKLENAICKDLEEENTRLQKEIADYRQTNQGLIKWITGFFK